MIDKVLFEILLGIEDGKFQPNDQRALKMSPQVRYFILYLQLAPCLLKL